MNANQRIQHAQIVREREILNDVKTTWRDGGAWRPLIIARHRTWNAINRLIDKGLIRWNGRRGGYEPTSKR